MKVSFFLMLFLIIIAINLYPQWERIGFDGQIIHDICQKSDELVIPVSINLSTIFYGSKTSGESWDSLGIINEQHIDEFEVINDVIITCRNWGCIFSCYGSCIFKSEDNSAQWDTIYYEEYGASNLLANKNIIYAQAAGNFIKSSDLGNNWDLLNSVPVEIGKLFSIDSTLYLSDFEESNFYKSTNDGMTWNFVSNNPLRPYGSLIKVAEYFFGDGDNISRTSNQGVDWESVNHGLPENFGTLHINSFENTILIAGWENRIPKVFYSSDFGASWLNISDGLNLLTSYKSILALENDSRHLYAATTDGIWRYDISSLVTGIIEGNSLKEYRLSQNYPNPFNPSTTISWQSPVGSWQTLKVYDLLGREVATLVDEYKPAGSYEVVFDGSKLSSGVYLYKLSAGDFIQTKKLILMK